MVKITKPIVDNLCRIRTGQYVGDGSTGMAVTGVGFRPKYVKVYVHGVAAARTYSFEAMDQFNAGLSQYVPNDAMAADAIISLDVDGFTVDDGGADNNPNKSGVTYDYLCLG